MFSYIPAAAHVLLGSLQQPTVVLSDADTDARTTTGTRLAQVDAALTIDQGCEPVGVAFIHAPRLAHVAQDEPSEEHREEDDAEQLGRELEVHRSQHALSLRCRLLARLPDPVWRREQGRDRLPFALLLVVVSAQLAPPRRVRSGGLLADRRDARRLAARERLRGGWERLLCSAANCFRHPLVLIRPVARIAFGLTVVGAHRPPTRDASPVGAVHEAGV